MALPALTATFAANANLPRKQMLAKWLVAELGSGSISDYATFPEKHILAKIAVAAGGPKTEADYLGLNVRYIWNDIYNAVSGKIAESTVVVTGLSATQYNGRYVYDGDVGGKPSYRLNASVSIFWDSAQWNFDADGDIAYSASDVAYPWLVTNWQQDSLDPSGLKMTPELFNLIDTGVKEAYANIAAAYRGDTGNPTSLATYYSWPFRYQVAAIIDAV